MIKQKDKNIENNMKYMPKGIVYYAKAIRPYDPLRTKPNEMYPIKLVQQCESYVITERGKMPIEHPSFDYYFTIKEVKED